MLSSFKLTQIQDLNSSCTALYQGLRNSIFELIEQADDDPEYAIHDIRKRLKMIRAFLKMIKPGLPEKCYETTNIYYRNIGRMLSEVRDAHSRRQLLARFESEITGDGFQTLFREMNSVNNGMIGELEQTLFVDFNIFQRVKKKLDTPDPNLVFEDFDISIDILIEGVSLTYENGFNAFFTSRLCSSPDLLHEWRKRVKDLQSQALYIYDVAGLAPHIDINELNELADHLGEIQDFNMTRDWILSLAPEPATVNDINRLSDLLKIRQEKLLKTTEYLGKSIFRLDPERFKLQLQSLFR